MEDKELNLSLIKWKCGFITMFCIWIMVGFSRLLPFLDKIVSILMSCKIKEQKNIVTRCFGS
jgi:hypothetical protein